MTEPDYYSIVTAQTLRAVADQIEQHPESYNQGFWAKDNVHDPWTFDNPDRFISHLKDESHDVQTEVLQCGTNCCIAGWSVVFSPREMYDSFGGNWEAVGQTALGLDEELAEMLFDENFVHVDVPNLLRALADLPAPRTVDKALDAGIELRLNRYEFTFVVEVNAADSDSALTAAAAKLQESPLTYLHNEEVRH